MLRRERRLHSAHTTRSYCLISRTNGSATVRIWPIVSPRFSRAAPLISSVTSKDKTIRLQSGWYSLVVMSGNWVAWGLVSWPNVCLDLHVWLATTWVCWFVNDDDKEIRHDVSLNTSISDEVATNPVYLLLVLYSNYCRMQRALCWWLRIKNHVRRRVGVEVLSQSVRRKRKSWFWVRSEQVHILKE